jgi:predicted DNA-binding protein with PD1-like motif
MHESDAREGERGARTFVVVFDPGEEAIAGLTGFAAQEGLAGSHFTALGAFSGATVGSSSVSDVITLRSRSTSRSRCSRWWGNIVIGPDRKPVVHAHAVLGKQDGTAHGGHLLEGRVWPTLEVVVTESPRHLRRNRDEATGLALITLEEEG